MAVINLEERVAAIEEKLKNEARTSQSLIPLFTAMLAEWTDGEEIRTASIQLWELMQIYRNNEQYNIETALRYFLWLNSGGGN